MKSKGSASLYEVLKSASQPSEGAGTAASEETPPPQTSESGGPTLQERLAAYKAAKLAAVTQPPPSVAAVVSAETPVKAPISAAPVSVVSEEKPLPAAKGPGERVLRLTYNTAAFAALVVLGLVFVAYAIGVQTGRKRAMETAAAEAPVPAPVAAREFAAPPPKPPPPPPPPPAPREYTIRLAEWGYAKPQERLKADLAADDLRRALDRANFKGSRKDVIQRGGEPRLALYIDAFTDPSAQTVKTRFAAIQKVKVGTQYPFAQAQIEEAPK
jgi:hypothetical protein